MFICHTPFQNDESLAEATATTYKTSPTTDAKHSSTDMKKVQRLNRELSKQNSQLLKSVDAFKRERESLLAEKQKLKSENKQLEKELKKSSPTKKGSQKHSSRAANTFEASFEEMESLSERVEKLEAQLLARDMEITVLQKREELQSGLLREGDTLEMKKELVDVDVHELEDSNDEKNRKNRETIEPHLALSRYLEEQETSSQMRKENSELKFKMSSMEEEIEQLKGLLEHQKALQQQVEQSPKASKKSAFFKRGKKQALSMSAHNLEDGQRFMREQQQQQAPQRSRSPDIHTTSDSALHRFTSHGWTDEKPTTAPTTSPRGSPHFSRQHRSGSALADVQTLQTCLKLAFEEKSSLAEQNKLLNEELKEAKLRIEKVLHNSPRIRKANQEVEVLKQTLKALLMEKESLSEQVVFLQREVDDSKAKQETMASDLADTLVKKDFKIERLERDNERLTQEVSQLKVKVKAAASAAVVSGKASSTHTTKPVEQTQPDNLQSSHTKAKMAPPSPSSATQPASRDSELPSPLSSPPSNAISPVRNLSGIGPSPSSFTKGAGGSGRPRERLHTAPTMSAPAKSSGDSPPSPLSPPVNKEKKHGRSSSMESDVKPVESSTTTTSAVAAAAPPSSSSSFQAQKAAISEKSESTPEFKTSETGPHSQKLFRRNQSRTKVSAARAMFEVKIEEHTSPKKAAAVPVRKVSWTLGGVGGGGGQGTASSSDHLVSVPADATVKTHSKSSSFDSAKIMSTVVSPPSSATTGKPKFFSMKTEPQLRTESSSEGAANKRSSTFTTSPATKEPPASKVSSIAVRSSVSPQVSPVLGGRKEFKQIPVHSPTKTSRDAATKQLTFGPTSPQKSPPYTVPSQRGVSFTPQGEVRLRSSTATTAAAAQNSTPPSSSSSTAAAVTRSRRTSFISTTSSSSSSETKPPPVTKSFTVARFSSSSSASSSSLSSVQPQTKTVISPSPQVAPPPGAAIRTEKVVIRHVARKLSVPLPTTTSSSTIIDTSTLRNIPEQYKASFSDAGGKREAQPQVNGTATARQVPLRMNRRPRNERPATMFAGSGQDKLASLVVQLQEQERQKKMNGSARASQRPASMVFPSEE